MKRFLFAVAVVALAASASFAADPPVTGPTTAPPTGAVIVGTPGTVVVDSAPAPARRGLFGRLRNRNNSTPSYSPAPIMTAPPGTIAPPPAPMPGAIPVPMPGRTGTSLYMPMPGSPSGVVVAGGTLPPGTYTATDGTIITIGGSELQPMMQSPMMQPAMMQEPTSQRRGLFGRLRNR